MSKKKKRNKKKKVKMPVEASVEVLDLKAKDALGQNDFRRAKNILKELYKRCPDKYQTMLKQCYNSLAGEMLQQDRVIDAEGIYEQLSQLTGEVPDPAVQVRLSLASGRFSSASQIAADLYCNESLSPDGEVARMAADALVLSFEKSPQLKSCNPSLAVELGAVQSALQSVCSGQMSKAADILKIIGLRSIFSDWKLFIKGLIAYYSGEDDKALRCFRCIPKGSTVAGAAAPFVYLLDERARQWPRGESREHVLRDVCLITGRNDLTDILPRAEYLWYVKRFSDSYDHVSKKYKDFPSERPGLFRNLSRFYFNSIFHMDPERAENYIDRLMRKIQPSTREVPAAALLLLRATNLFETPFLNDHDLVEIWQQFLYFYNRRHGENKNLSAMVYAHLGALFSVRVDSVPEHVLYWEGKPKSKLRNPTMAEKYFKLSIELVPRNKDYHLGLLNVYELSGNKRSLNKKLDEMSTLFPDSKETLVKNGQNCIDRKAFLKGIDYLESALALDPIDKDLKEVLAVAYIKASLSYARKGKPDNYREFMSRALALEDTDTSSFNFGHLYLKSRLALFEFISGNQRQGQQILDAVFAQEQYAYGLYYFTYLIAGFYQPPVSNLKQIESGMKREFKEPLASKAVRLIDIISYIGRIDGDSRLINREYKRVDKYCLKAVKYECSETDAGKVIDYAFFRGWAGKPLRKAYIEKMLDRDARSPLFLYYQYKDATEKRFDGPREKDLERLREILILAMDRSDSHLVETLHKEISTLEKKLEFIDQAADPSFNENHYNDTFDIGDILNDLGNIPFEHLEKIGEILESAEPGLPDTADPFGGSGKRSKKPKQPRKKSRPQSPMQQTLFEFNE